MDKDDATQKRRQFCDLPCELQLQVLSHLTHAELGIVSQVCTTLRRLAFDQSLWRKVKVPEDMDERWLYRVLDCLPLIEDLNLRSSTRVSVWAEHAERLSRLRVLDLGFSVDVNSAALSRFVEHSPRLSHVNVEGCKNVDDAAIRALCPLAGLLSLNIAHCFRVTDEGLLTLAENCPRLVFLNVDDISSITDRAVCGVAEHLGSQLVSLELDGQQLTDASFQAVGRCNRLETLTVFFMDNLTDISLAHIKELQNLRRLELRRGPHLTANGLRSLFQGDNLSRLVTLELEDLALDDQALALLVIGCPQLRVLSLPGCVDITEAGLASIVNNCTNLEGLVLIGVYQICGCCLEGLAMSMPKLRHLDLEMCYFSNDSVLEFLARRLPKLKVYNYYGHLVSSSDDSPSTEPFHLDSPSTQPIHVQW